jgi:DNA gyrase subunit A
LDGEYYLSPEQAQAILDLRLHRLTGLETDKIHDEYKQLIDQIKALMEILSNPDRLHAVIREELIAIKTQFGDARRTVILENHEDLSNEDLITEEDLVVTLSHEGYIKAQSLDSYESQHRGGRGKRATSVKEEDYVKNILVANSHHTILCFSTVGKVYWLKTYQIPQAGRAARGQPIVNLLPLEKEELITAILPVAQFDENHFIFMATQKGTVKKVALSEFSNPRSNGKIALGLNDGDRLIGVALTDGKQDIMLVSDVGKAIRFAEDHVRAMGRTATGIRGIRLKDDQKLIALIIPKKDGTILTVTENGYGQRTEVNDYRECGRGGQGVIAIQTTDRNGKVVGSIPVQPDSEILLVTNGGTLVRIPVAEINVIGRNTQGVRLINVQEGEQVVSVEGVDATIGAIDE